MAVRDLSATGLNRMAVRGFSQTAGDQVPAGQAFHKISTDLCGFPLQKFSFPLMAFIKPPS